MPSSSNDAVEPLNELYLEEPLAYCVLLPLNCNLSPEFTVILTPSVLDVIGAQLPSFNLYSMVLVRELSDAVQLIVPGDVILNVKGSLV